MIIDTKQVLLKNGKVCVLRSPRLDDAEQLIEYLKISAGETDFLLKYPEEVRISVEQERDILKQFIDSERDLMIVAEVDGKIVGNCSFSPLGNKIRFRHRCSIGIALYESAWGVGIGTSLLMLLIEKATECGYEQMELEVVRRNVRAVKLYEKVGFVKCGDIPRAMKHKDDTYDDAIMMVKVL